MLRLEQGLVTFQNIGLSTVTVPPRLLEHHPRGQRPGFGAQLDPPAHWHPSYPAIDELPPTYTLRPLVVISIVPQLAENANYALQAGDVLSWEERHGRVPAGSVVFVRSDWSKRWPDPGLATLRQFPGVSLAALKFRTSSATSCSTAMSRWTPTARQRSKARRG